MEWTDASDPDRTAFESEGQELEKSSRRKKDKSTIFLRLHANYQDYLLQSKKNSSDKKKQHQLSHFFFFRYMRKVSLILIKV